MHFYNEILQERIPKSGLDLAGSLPHLLDFQNDKSVTFPFEIIS
jgi:hypothetical protein